MKKKIIITSTILFTIILSIIVIFEKQNSIINDQIIANVEALADTEMSSDGYHLKTVACGGRSFEDWIPYCCPGLDACSTGKSCNATVYGC